MKDFLLRLVKSKTFKAVLGVLAAALTAYAASGCGLLSARHPEFTVFECQLDALADAVPRAAAEDLVMAARAGNIEYVVAQLLALGLAPDAIGDVADAFHACQKPAPDLEAPPAAPLPPLTDV